MGKSKPPRKSNDNGALSKQTAYHAVFQSSQYAIGISLKGVHTSVNKAYVKLFGYKSESELIEKPIIDLIAPDERKKVLKNIRDRTSGRKAPRKYQTVGMRKDGSTFPMDVQIISYNFKGSAYTVAQLRDITKLRSVESDLTSTNRTLNLLNQCNKTIIRAKTERELLDKICKVIVKSGDFSLCWIGFAGDDKNKSIVPVANTGIDDGYVESLKISWANTPRGKGPTGRAFRTGKVIVTTNILEDKGFSPWKKAASKIRVKSSIALPLIRNKSVLGILNIYSSAVDRFTSSEQNLLKQLADDLAYGLHSLREEASRKEAESMLKSTEERLLMIYENTADLLVLTRWTGKDLIVESMNRAIVSAANFQEKEVIGKSIFDILSPESAKKRLSQARKAIRTKKPVNFVRVENLPAGSISIETTQVPIFDKKGKCTHILGISKNVTAQITAQNKIVQSAKEFEILHSLGSKLGKNLSLKRTAQTAAREIAKAIVCDTVFIFIRTGESLQLKGLYSNFQSEEFESMPIHKVGECMCGLAAANGKPMYSKNIFCDERCTWQECKKIGMKSFGALPLKFGHDIIGVIGISAFEETDYSEYEQFLKTLSSTVSVHLNNSLIYSDMIKTAESLRRSERLFRSLSSNSPVGIFKTDSRGKTDFVNERMLDLLGIPQEEACGSGWMKIIRQEDRTAFKHNFRIAVKTRSTLKSEFRLQHKGGNEIWILFEMAPIFNDAGVIRGFIGTLTDVSEEKLTREMLANSEEKFRAVVQQMTDGIAIVSDKGVIIEWNESLERITEQPRDEMIGKFIWDLEFRFLPKAQRTKENYEVIQRQVQKMLSTRKSSERTFQIRKIVTNSGAEKYVQGSLFLIHTSGGKIICSLSRDMTEEIIAKSALEASEERYRKLFDSAVVGIGLSRISGELLEVNDELLKVLKIKRRNVSKVDIRDYYKNINDRNKLLETLQKFGSVDNAEVEMIRSDGDVIWTNISIKTVSIGEENVLLFFISDITEKRRALEAVKNHQQQLRSLTSHLQDQTEEERAIIAREIHDEFGQILTSIKMGLQFALDQLEEESGTTKSFMQTEIESMNKLIDGSMIKMRRLITNLRPDVLDKAGLTAALDEQKVDFASKFKGRVKYVNRLGTDKFDPKLEIALFRIFQEATNNILRHSKAKKAAISVSKTEKNIICVFEDDGVGFSVREAAQKGSFGLVGIRERTAGWGGKMELKTSPGHGTKLKLTIPVIFE